jgi:hypothetical protein
MGGGVPVDNETLLVTDFMNLKIKSAQSFGCAHRGRVYVRMFIWVSAHMCMNIYICTVFLKKYNTFLIITSSSKQPAITLKQSLKMAPYFLTLYFATTLRDANDCRLPIFSIFIHAMYC